MWQTFYPQTIENKAAIRTAICTLIAVLLAFKLHFDTPYWAGMTVLIVANIYTGSIVDKAILRIIGTIIGAWFGFFMTRLIVNSFPLFLISNFLFIAVATYFFIFSRYAYAYLLAGISGFIVIAQLAMEPQNAFFVAIWRPVEIGLGVIISALGAFCLFPNNIHEALEEQIKDIFHGLESQMGVLQNSLNQNILSSDDILKTNLALKKKLRKASEMIGYMRREIGITRERIDEFRAVLDLVYQLSRILNYFIILLKDKHTITAFKSDDMNPVFEAFKQDIQNILRLFLKETTDFELATPKILHLFNESTSSSDTNKAYYEISHLFKQINTALLRMYEVLSKKTQWTPQQHFLKTHLRLSRDPDVFKHASRVGASAVLALCFWILSDWPGGLNGIISSIIISIKKTSFEMKSTSLHRLLGCFAGGGVALGFIFFVEMNLFNFILVILFFIWIFNYFAFKYPKYAYIGLQAGIALVITLAQEGGPPVHLTPPLQRLGGVLIGIAASYIVANTLWRSNPLHMLESKLRKLFNLLSYNLNQILLQPRENIKIHDLTNLFWVSRGLIESLGNSELSALKEARFKKMTRVFDDLVILQATLTHIYIGVDRDKAHESANFYALGLNTMEEKISAIYHTRLKVQGVHNEVEQMIERVQNQKERVGRDDLINLFAYLNSFLELTRKDSLDNITRTLHVKSNRKRHKIQGKTITNES